MSAELGKVAVLMGGPSSEREISFLSGNAVLAAGRKAKAMIGRVPESVQVLVLDETARIAGSAAS